MAGPTTATVTAATGIATVLSMMPFGVSLNTLFIGGGCFFAGSCARTGLTLYKQLDTPGAVLVAGDAAAKLGDAPGINAKIAAASALIGKVNALIGGK